MEDKKEMLQFSQDFLQPEIREDFYIDAAMKTVWAAELDLLQTIAEVCDRYGLQWYAAYGTLLGAIRHEGFIPWDDDLDIWMKREDYQKLLAVLPGELPQEYHVFSPQTEEGYEQYHTCVVCGEGISIEPQYLERHYGCPFQVGVDIFPLDYLPRDQERCQYQRSVFQLVKRIVQTVQECRDLSESSQKQCGPRDSGGRMREKRDFDSCEKEIRYGIRILEEHCGYRIEARLLEEKQWGELISVVYRIANEVIRNCSEQDADYLVMFRDYANEEEKIFPKEWFDEAWGATFENLMLPIPWKYDEILRRIYGNWQVRHRDGTSHEYPYYEKQLDHLREIARERAKSENREAEENELPTEWEILFARTDGGRKKAVLFMNDISEFIMYGEEALDKLEASLRTFYEAREQIVLWWRPCQEMISALTLADYQADILTEGQADSAAEHQIKGNDTAKRYDTILKQYKAQAWGICDESSDKQRAVEFCTAYYGAKNSMVVKFQNLGKPVMIAAGK